MFLTWNYSPGLPANFFRFAKVGEGDGAAPAKRAKRKTEKEATERAEAGGKVRKKDATGRAQGPEADKKVRKKIAKTAVDRGSPRAAKARGGMTKAVEPCWRSLP